jgi:hypothetical protein
MTLSNFWRNTPSCCIRAFLGLYSQLSIFLVSLNAKQPRIAVYTVDLVAGAARADLRAFELYRQLQTYHLSYFEFIHIASLKLALINALKRKRLSCYLEQLGAKDSEQLTIRIKAILRKLNIQRVVAIDDYRHTAELLRAARELGIASVALQHGCNLSSPMFPQERRAFDKLIVWSDFFARQYKQFCPEQTVVVCKHPRYRQPLVLNRKLTKTVLVIEEVGIATELLYEFLVALILKSEFVLRLRLRPGHKTPSAAYRKFFTDDQCLASSDVFDDLCSAAVVIGSYSSVLYQALLVGCGVVVLHSDRYAEPLLVADVASFAQVPEQLLSAIAIEMQLSDADRQRRCEVIWGGRDDGDLASQLLG